MVKTVTNINNNTITFDTDKYIIDKLKITNICDSSDSTGSSGDSIVADGNGGWSWGPGGGSEAPAGSSGDVIISDGSSGFDSSNILNVNHTNGTITGTGALTVVGGVGISENLSVGGNVEIDGSIGIPFAAANPQHQKYEVRPYFGRSLALSRDGKFLAIGTTHDPTGGTKAGAIYVYKRTDLSQNFGILTKAIGSPSGIWPSSEFGHQLGLGVSISDDGNTVVGTASDSQVTVIKFSSGSWTTTSFYPPDLNYLGADGGEAGIHLNASGNIMLITYAVNSYLGKHTSGSAWVYEYINSNWIQKGATIHGREPGDQLGSMSSFHAGTASLSKDGLTFSLGRNKVEDGYKGEIVVYDWNGTSWAPRTPITGTVNGEYRMINDLSDDGNTILVGGRTASKIAKVLDWNGTSWVQRGTDLIMPTWQSYFAISGDSNTLLFGNPSSSDGFIEVYKYISNSWTLSNTIQQVGNKFGAVISVTPGGNNFVTSDFEPFTSTVYIYGLPGIDYGNAGDVLTNNASGLPEWMSPTAPTPDFLLFDIGTQQNLNMNQWNSIKPTYSFGGTAAANNSKNITIDPTTGIITFVNTGTYVINVNFQGYWALATNVNIQLHPGTVTIPTTSATMEAFTNTQRQMGMYREVLGWSGLPVNITVPNTTKRFWLILQGGSHNGFLPPGNGGGTCGSIIRIV